MTNSDFGLYRITPQGQDWLCYSDNNLILNFERSLNICRFNFVNASGYQAKFLVNGVVYFPVVISEGQTKYLQYNSGVYTLTSESQNRVFMYIPSGTTYLTSTNVAGFFFVSSGLLWKSLTDLYFLGNPSSDILSKDCVPNCGGKVCTQDNGCGLPCGCVPGKTCLKDGTCASNVEPSPVCRDNSNCNGPCPGNCPFGYRCARNISGKYFCQKYLDNQLTLGFLILIFLLILAVGLTFYLWKWSSSSSSSQSGISRDSKSGKA